MPPRERGRASPRPETLFAELGGAHQRVYHSDPLVCKGCGGPLKIVAYITDEISIARIRSHRRPARWSGYLWMTRGSEIQAS